MERELIFQESDDLQADNTDFFKMDFRDRIGENFDKWKKKADRKRDAETGVTTYTLEDIQVEISTDHPFYVVYEIKK